MADEIGGMSTPKPFAPVDFNAWSASPEGARIEDPLQKIRAYDDRLRKDLYREGLYTEEAEKQIVQAGADQAVRAGHIADLAEYAPPIAATAPDDNFLASALIGEGNTEKASAIYRLQSFRGRADTAPETLARAEQDAALDPTEVNRLTKAAVRTGKLPFAVVQNDQGDQILEVDPELGALSREEILDLADTVPGGVDPRVLPMLEKQFTRAPGSNYTPAQARQESIFAKFISEKGKSDDFLAGQIDDAITEYNRAGVLSDETRSTLDRTLTALDADNEFSPASRTRYVDDMIKRAARPEGYDPENPQQHVQYLNDGSVWLPDQVVFNGAEYKGTLDKLTGITTEQKEAAIAQREARLEAVAPQYVDAMGADPDALDFYTKSKAEGKTDSQIATEWYGDKTKYSAAANRLRSTGMAAWDATWGFVQSVQAMAFDDKEAMAALVARQGDMARNEEYARLSGDSYGIGQSAINTAPQVVADILLTMAASAVGTPAAGAAVIGARTAGMAAVRSLARTAVTSGTKSTLKTFVRGGAVRAATALGTLGDDLVKKMVLEVGPQKAVGAAVSRMAGSVGTTSALASTTFARAAGSSYVSTYSALDAQTLPNGTPRYTDEEKRKIALSTATISGISTAAITLGFGAVLGPGVEGLVSGKLGTKALKGVFGMTDETIVAASRSSALAILKSAGAEAPEEAVDQLLSGVYEKIASGEEFRLGPALKEALEAGAVGGLLGAGAGAIQALATKPRDPAVTKLEAAGAPLTAAAVEAQAAPTATPATPERGGLVEQPGLPPTPDTFSYGDEDQVDPEAQTRGAVRVTAEEIAADLDEVSVELASLKVEPENETEGQKARRQRKIQRLTADKTRLSVMAKRAKADGGVWINTTTTTGVEAAAAAQQEVDALDLEIASLSAAPEKETKKAAATRTKALNAATAARDVAAERVRAFSAPAPARTAAPAAAPAPETQPFPSALAQTGLLPTPGLPGTPDPFSYGDEQQPTPEPMFVDDRDVVAEPGGLVEQPGLPQTPDTFSYGDERQVDQQAQPRPRERGGLVEQPGLPQTPDTFSYGDERQPAVYGEAAQFGGPPTPTPAAQERAATEVDKLAAAGHVPTHNDFMARFKVNAAKASAMRKELTAAIRALYPLVAPPASATMKTAKVLGLGDLKDAKKKLVQVPVFDERTAPFTNDPHITALQLSAGRSVAVPAGVSLNPSIFLSPDGKHVSASTADTGQVIDGPGQHNRPSYVRAAYVPTKNKPKYMTSVTTLPTAAFGTLPQAVTYAGLEIDPRKTAEADLIAYFFGSNEKVKKAVRLNSPSLSDADVESVTNSVQFAFLREIREFFLSPSDVPATVDPSGFGKTTESYKEYLTARAPHFLAAKPENYWTDRGAPASPYYFIEGEIKNAQAAAARRPKEAVGDDRVTTDDIIDRAASRAAEEDAADAIELFQEDWLEGAVEGTGILIGAEGVPTPDAAADIAARFIRAMGSNPQLRTAFNALIVNASPYPLGNPKRISYAATIRAMDDTDAFMVGASAVFVRPELMQNVDFRAMMAPAVNAFPDRAPRIESPAVDVESEVLEVLETRLTPEEKTRVAGLLGHDSWTPEAAKDTSKALADWRVSNKSVSTAIAAFFESVWQKLRTGTLSLMAMVSLAPSTVEQADGSWVSVAEIVAESPLMGPAAPGVELPDWSNAKLSDDTRIMASWVLGKNDAKGMNFVIADKVSAEVHIFRGDGELIYSTPGLFGFATGSDTTTAEQDRMTVPQLIADKTSHVTPAGKFVSKMRPNPTYGEALVFGEGTHAVAAFHEISLAIPAQKRGARLASETAADNSISMGCINLSKESMAALSKASQDPVAIYVMPSTEAGRSLFDGFGSLPTRPSTPAAKAARGRMDSRAYLDQASIPTIREDNAAAAADLQLDGDLRSALERIVRSAKFPRRYRAIAKAALQMQTLPSLHMVDSPTAAYAGFYSGSSNSIHLNMASSNGRGLLDVLMHEMLHAATAEIVRNPRTAKERALRDRLERYRIAVAGNVPSDMSYAVSSLDEFITHCATDPRFQRIARETIDRGRSVWDKIVEAVASFFGITNRGFVSDLWGFINHGAEYTNRAETLRTPSAPTLFSFAGERANVPQFMRDSLETAKAMAAEGKDSETIRAVTGWFPGKYDGKMRWEIPDNEATLRLDDFRAARLKGESAQDIARNHFARKQEAEMDAAMEKSFELDGPALLEFSRNFEARKRAENVGLNTFFLNEQNRDRGRVPLAYLLDHPALFEAYPDLKWMPVSFSANDIGSDATARGAYNPNFGGIALNPLVAYDDSIGALSTLLHETQHAIQKIEGFAKGGNITVGARLVAKSDPKVVAAKQAAIEAEAEYDRLHAAAVKRIRSAREGNPVTLENELADIEPEVQDAIAKMVKAKVAASYAEPNIAAARVSEDAAFGAYREIAGEIEARDVQARANMTPEQRAAVEPYSSENISTEAANILFEDTGINASIPVPSRRALPDPTEVESRTVAGKTVGTRSPKAKGVKGTGVNQELRIDLASARLDPKLYKKNAFLLSSYAVVAKEFPEIAARSATATKALEAHDALIESKRADVARLGAALTKSIKESRAARGKPLKGKAGQGAAMTAIMEKESGPLATEWRATKKKLKQLVADRPEVAKKTTAKIDEAAANLTMEEADALYEGLKTATRDNLKALIDLFPARLRDVAKLWYDGANIIAQGFAKSYNLSLEQTSAVIAVFSPQKDWFMNVAIAKRTMDIWTNHQNTPFSDAMAKNFLDRAGQPQFVYDKKGEQQFSDPETKLVPKYTGGAVPILNETGTAIVGWSNWSAEKAAKSVEDARLELVVMRGKTLAQLEGRHQAVFIRMHEEVNNPGRGFPIISPDGNFGGNKQTEPDKNGQTRDQKLGWGSYVTIDKAIAIMTAPKASEMQVISDALGEQHKVRSFYNNIVDPQSKDGHVTMDTHAIAALLWQALSGASRAVTQNFGGAGTASSGILGVNGLYPAFAEAYRALAADLEMLPRQVQSITWEAIRILFPAKWKSQKSNVAKVDKVWQDYRDGTITADDARTRIFELTNPRATGGARSVAEPDWTQIFFSGADPAGSQEADDQGVLPADRESVMGSGRGSVGSGMDRDAAGLPDGTAGRGGVAVSDAEYSAVMARYKDTPSVEVTGQGRAFSPIIRDLLNRRAAGENISRGVFDRAVKEHFPSRPIVAPKSSADLPSEQEVFDAIRPNQQEKHLAAEKAGPPAVGSAVTVRQDVPAWTDNKVGVVTTVYKVGKDTHTTYRASTKIENPVFDVTKTEKLTEPIGRGENKKPHITVSGTWSADQSLPPDLETWTQVGFNPDRHSYYYERGTERMVVGGRTAFQIGNTVFVKDAVFGDAGQANTRYAQSPTTGTATTDTLDRYLPQPPAGMSYEFEGTRGKYLAYVSRSAPNTITINRAGLNALIEGLDPANARAIVRKIVNHEIAHHAAFSAFTPAEITEMASRLSPSDLVDIASKYYGLDPVAAFERMEADMESGTLSEEALVDEYLRMHLERVTDGATTEDTIAFHSNNPGFVARFVRYLKDALAKMWAIVGGPNEDYATRVEISRLMRELRAIQNGHRAPQPVPLPKDNLGRDNVRFAAAPTREPRPEDAIFDKLQPSTLGTENPYSPASLMSKLFRNKMGDRRLHQYLEQRGQNITAIEDLAKTRGEALKKAIASEKPPQDVVDQALGERGPTTTAAQNKAIKDVYDAAIKAARNATASPETKKALAASRDTAIADAGTDAEAVKMAKKMHERLLVMADAEAQKSAVQEAARMKDAMRRAAIIETAREAKERISYAQSELDKNFPKTGEAVRKGREFIDRMSEGVSSILPDSGHIKFVVDTRNGVYLTMAYNLHHSDGNPLDIMSDPDKADIVAAAKEQLMRALIEGRAEELIDEQAEAGLILGETEAREAARTELVDQGIDQTIVEDYLLEHGSKAVYHSGSKFSADWTRFMKQNEVPEALRALLGEITDPVQNLMRSAMNVGTLAASMRLAEDFAAGGHEIGALVTRQQKDVFRKMIQTKDEQEFLSVALEVGFGRVAPKKGYLPWEKELDGAPVYLPVWLIKARQERDIQYLDNFRAIAGKEGKYGVGRLSEFLAHPDVAGTIEEIFATRGGATTDSTKLVEKMGNALAGMTGVSLGVATLGSIGFFSRQIFAVPVALASNGINPVSKDVYRAVGLAMGIVTGKESYWKTRLNALGMSLDDLRPSVLKELVKTEIDRPGGFNILEMAGKLIDKAAMGATDGKGVLTGTKLTEYFSKLGEVVSAIDSVAKIAAFFTELRVIEAAYPDKSKEWHETEAAETVKRTMQARSQSMPIFDALGKSSYGRLMSPFLRFKGEVFRLAHGIPEQAMREIRSGIPVLVKRGRTRMAGFSVAMAFSIAGPAVLSALFGVGDDEEYALRQSLPPYLRGSSLIYRKSEDGRTVTSINTTYLNYLAMIGDPISRVSRAVLRGDASDAADEAAIWFTSQFLEDQIFAGAAFEVLRNETSDGRKITFETDNFADAVIKKTQHMFGSAFTPQILKVADRAIRTANNGVPADAAFLETPAGIILGHMAPVKPVSIDLNEAAVKAGRTFFETNRDIRSVPSQLKRRRGMGEDEIKDVIDEWHGSFSALNTDMARAARGFESMGLAKPKVSAALTEAGFSKERSRELVFAGLVRAPAISPALRQDIIAAGDAAQGKGSGVKRLQDAQKALRAKAPVISVSG